MSNGRSGVDREYRLTLPAEMADWIKALARANKTTEIEIIRQLVFQQLIAVANVIEAEEAELL